MDLLLTLNPEHVTEQEGNTYATRGAARAVVLDTDNNIALLHVVNEKYYKLPGGGLESQEDPITALRRECLEEIGADIDVVGEVGLIVEYRKFEQLKQTSYCYLARLKGEKGRPTFTETEMAGGFQAEWVPLAEARRLFDERLATSLEGSAYIVKRDIRFLEEAEKQIKKIV